MCRNPRRSNPNLNRDPDLDPTPNRSLRVFNYTRVGVSVTIKLMFTINVMVRCNDVVGNARCNDVGCHDVV